MSKAGVARLGIFDTDVDRCASVAKRIRIHFPDVAVETGSNDPAGRDIVTNATPLGMNADDPLPLDVDRLAPESFVGEVVLTKEETRLLAAARARGCATQLGTDMLFEQIPAYLEFFGFPTTTSDELRRLSRIEY